MAKCLEQVDRVFQMGEHQVGSAIAIEVTRGYTSAGSRLLKASDICGVLESTLFIAHEQRQLAVRSIRRSVRDVAIGNGYIGITIKVKSLRERLRNQPGSH